MRASRIDGLRHAAWLVYGFGLILVGTSAAIPVDGYVLDGASGLHVAGVSLTFLGRDSTGTFQELAHQVSDTQGEFTFSDPRIGPDLEFRLQATYQGVAYPGSVLRVGSQDEVVVEVYPVTADSTAIRVTVYSLFLTMRGDEIDVAHWVQVENTGTGTYIGRGQGETRRVTPFVLPSGAYAVQSRSGVLVGGPGGRVYDSQPLLPGFTRIVFTFRLDARSLSKGYLHQVAVPTDLLDVYLTPGTLPLGADLQDLGTVDLQGSSYHHGWRKQLRPGDRVSIPWPRIRDLGSVVRWGALAGVLLALGGVVAASVGIQRRRLAIWPLTADAVQRLELHRRALIEQLAELDDPGGHGQRERRQQQLIDETVAVTRILDGRSDGI